MARVHHVSDKWEGFETKTAVAGQGGRTSCSMVLFEVASLATSGL